MNARSAPAATRQRHDIEGLRALAVLLVVGSHLLLQPAGGFVGVDVFFVISRFLITGLLVREVERTGRISFREFYARRIRRILPAALLVLAVTCVAARLLFFDSRARQTYVDSAWAAVSLANWHLAAVGTDYFQSTQPPSVVQQYWSLAVEEQFYLVWPVLILLIAALARRGSARGVRLAVGAALGLVVAGSFAWAVHQSGSETTVAYFSTLTRGWELGLGGLLALAVPWAARMPTWLGRVLAWGGLAQIVVAGFLTVADGSFPAPGALPSVLGAVLVIAGGTVSGGSGLVLLTNPVSRFVGQISYSVYLWHWPVIAFAETLLPRDGWLFVVSVLAVTAVLSVGTFYAVEQPIRRTTWFSRRRPDTTRRGLSGTTRRRWTIGIAAVAVLAAAFTVRPQPPVTAPAAAAPAAGGPSAAPTGSAGQRSAGSPAEQAAAAWSRSLDQAVTADAWPDLQPSLDELGSARAANWDTCGNVDAEAMPDCRFGPPTAPRSRSMVVLGDSVAISWLPALRAGFEPKGWSIQGLTFGECPGVRLDVTSTSGDRSFTGECADHQRFALDQTVERRPALVIISTTEGTLNRVVGASAPDAAASAYGRALTETARRLTAAGSRVVVVSSPPSRRDLPSCATRVGTPADCLSSVSGTWQTMAGAERAASAAGRAAYVDTRALTCSRGTYCPGFVGVTPVMADGVHLTDAIARRLGPLLYPMIVDAKP